MYVAYVQYVRTMELPEVKIITIGVSNIQQMAVINQ